MSFKISKVQACRFLLAHQGLWPPKSLKGKQGIQELIHKLGCIQYDPLNIAGFNHELVLQSRIAGFRPEMMQQLLYQDRKLIDYWDKNMSIYSIEDWPYFERVRRAYHQRLNNTKEASAEVIPDIRKSLEVRGPLSSLDLDFDQAVDWWWGTPTRLARAALESMYFWGELVIHHKVHTRRYYDFAHKLVPPELYQQPDPNVSDEQFHDWYVLRRIGSVGILWGKSGDAWLGMYKIKSPQRTAAIARLLKAGKLIQVEVENISVPMYIRAQDQPLFEQVLHSDYVSNHTSIIAPLDNLIWDRRLIKELFGFEYRWEVYKPEAERDYGYYVLPILYGDRFVARFEPGRDKATGALLIKNWWWEPGIRQTQKLKSSILRCFKGFTRYLDCTFMIEPGTEEINGLSWLRFTDKI